MQGYARELAIKQEQRINGIQKDMMGQLIKQYFDEYYLHPMKNCRGRALWPSRGYLAHSKLPLMLLSLRISSKPPEIMREERNHWFIISRLIGNPILLKILPPGQ